MRMVRSGSLLLASCMVAAIALSQADPGFLIRTAYKVGDSQKAKVALTLDFGKPEGSPKPIPPVDVSIDSEDKVTDVDKDGNATIVSVQTNIVVTQNGKILQPQASSDPEKTVVSKINQLVSTDSTNKRDSFLIGRAAGVVFSDKPVKVGESYTVAYPKDDANELAEGKAEYKLVKVTGEGDDRVAELEWTYSDKAEQNPVTATGSAKVLIKNGLIKSSTVDILHMPTASGPAKSGHVVVTSLN